VVGDLTTARIMMRTGRISKAQSRSIARRSKTNHLDKPAYSRSRRSFVSGIRDAAVDAF